VPQADIPQLKFRPVPEQSLERAFTLDTGVRDLQALF
jgi:hypothetical protein